MPRSIDAIREQMINQQVRTWDVLDPAVLDVLNRTPRERFVAEHYQSLAFADANIPLRTGRLTLTPQVEGRILQALDLTPHDRVLEIGTGSGYLTACMARLARHVVSVDPDPELIEQAKSVLDEMGIRNCEFEARDPFDPEAPALEDEFDAIAVTGSIPAADTRLERMLRLNGRLFVVIGRAPIMDAWLIRRTGRDDWHRETLFETVIPRFPTASEPQGFEF